MGDNKENGLFEREESGSDSVDQTKINIWDRNENIKYCPKRWKQTEE